MFWTLVQHRFWRQHHNSNYRGCISGRQLFFWPNKFHKFLQSFNFFTWPFTYKYLVETLWHFLKISRGDMKFKKCDFKKIDILRFKNKNQNYFENIFWDFKTKIKIWDFYFELFLKCFCWTFWIFLHFCELFLHFLLHFFELLYFILNGIFQLYSRSALYDPEAAFPSRSLLRRSFRKNY